MSNESHFRVCSICRVPIAFGADYFSCSVSTCNRKRTALSFCSLACFEAHVPGARHRDAWAEAQTAPSAKEYAAQQALEATPPATSQPHGEPRSPQPGDAPGGRRVIAPTGATHSTAASSGDVLVVVSKIKKYVRETSGMNTSDGVAKVLSDHLREVCRASLRIAAQDDRRTVLDRDVAKALRER